MCKPGQLSWYVRRTDDLVAGIDDSVAEKFSCANFKLYLSFFFHMLNLYSWFMIPFKLMTNFVKLTQVPLTIYQFPFKMHRTSIIHPFYLCIPIQPLNLTYPEFQIPLTPLRIPLNLLRKRHKGWTVHAGPIGLVHWQIIEFIEWNVSFYNDLPHKYVVKLAKFSHLKSMVAWQAADIAVSMNNW